MKKITHFKRIFAAMLCLIMMFSIAPMSVNAAKEMFNKEITSAGVKDIDAPVAGQTGDYSGTPLNSTKYKIQSIDYYEKATNLLKPTTEAFKYDTEYYVLVTLKTNGTYYFAYSGDTGKPLASVTCNGNTATAYDLGPSANSTTIGIKYVFPKTEAVNPNVISTINLTGLDLPVHHMSADTTVSCNDFRVSTEVVWGNQDGSPFNGVFEYGKYYTAKIYLFTANSYDFAKDYTHPLASNDRPMPAVTVTLDGETIGVLPDYTRNQFMRVLVASKVYKCEQKLVVNSIRISGVKEPVAGNPINYSVNLDNSGFELAAINDAEHYKGVAWRVDGGITLPTSYGTFDAGETYQIIIRLVAKEGFEFDADTNGNTNMTATVNGKTAEVKSNRSEAIVTYTFPKTGNNVLKEVVVTDIDAPVTGQSPDYTATFGSTNYVPDNSVDASSKNGITWYNETDKKNVRPGDKFEAGKVYSVLVMVWAEDGCEFQYKSGSINIDGTINGQPAEVSARSNAEAILTYIFPKTEEHKCSPMKVAEHKATCTEEGKKEHYFCSECGKFFEDSKCTKEITSINTWGVIPVLEHTGGKATCDSRAICKNCGERYGELADHNYGTAWDYKDAIGHAHKCKVCGAPDTIQPHSGGTAKCGELAKCAECKAEYGEVMQHQWSTDWTYTDTKGHAHKCTVCGEHDTVQAHSGGTADCKNKAECSACGTEYGKTGDHQWSTSWDYTDTKGHAHKCTVCGDHDDIVKHTPGAAATETSSQNCTVCNYVIEPAKKHEHKLTKVAAVDASCTTAGKEQHYVCDGCGKLFSDAKGTKEITDEDSLIIPAAGHKDSKWESDADVHWKECTVKGCDTITVEKEAHEFNKSGKCKVCGYKSGEETDSSEATDTTDEEDTTLPDDTGEDTAATTPDTPDVTEPSDSGTDNTALWIAVIASGIVAVACIIVVAVVLAKKNKK